MSQPHCSLFFGPFCLSWSAHNGEVDRKWHTTKVPGKETPHWNIPEREKKKKHFRRIAVYTHLKRDFIEELAKCYTRQATFSLNCVLVRIWLAVMLNDGLRRSKSWTRFDFLPDYPAVFCQWNDLTETNKEAVEFDTVSEPCCIFSLWTGSTPPTSAYLCFTTRIPLCV